MYASTKSRRFFVYLTFIFLGSLAIAFGFLPSVRGTEEVRYASGARRDPFIPLVGPGGIVVKTFDPTDLKVEGIIFDPNQGSLVLINGEFYKQGERVKNATLISIFKDRVILSQDDEQKVIWIREEIAQEGQKKHEQSAQNPKP